MLNKIEFKKVRDFGETINDTFQFIKQNFRPMIKVFIYLCGFFILATIISTVVQQMQVQKLMHGGNPYRGFAMLQSMMTLSYAATALVGMASYTAMTVSTLSFIAIYVEKGNIAATVEEVWAYFKYYYFRVLVSSIVLTIFSLLCLLPCGTVFIYVFPAVSIFLPIMIIENGSFSFSFSRSFKLIKDNWGLTAGCLIIIWIITYATFYFASIPTIIISMVGVLSNGTSALNTATIIISAIIQSLCQIFLMIPLVCSTLCYFNLKERHEHTGLLSRINDLGEKEKPDFTEEY